MPTRVYKYGLLAPLVNAELVDEQISKAHRYYNLLVEIERARRTRARLILGKHGDVAPLAEEVDRLVGELEAGRAAIKQERAKTRRRSEAPEMRQVAKDIVLRLRDARARFKAAKQLIREDPEITAALEASDEQAGATIKTARAASGVYWGTYLLCEQAIDLARQERTDPKFRRWTGEGMVAVQLQGGMSWKDAISMEDTRLRIKHNGRRSRVFIRVGSEGRSPIWAEWPAVIHRDIPADAEIMWAKVVKERLEAHWRWELQLTLRLPDGWTSEACGTGAVAVDLGWRTTSEGIRVGYVVGDHGENHGVLLDEGVVPRLQKVDDLRSIRDKNLEKLRTWLVEWLRERFAGGEDVQERLAWLAEARATLHAWRSPARFAALALKWRGCRFDGDLTAYRKLEDWRKQDKHLWTWEVNLRDKVLRRRREQYRVLGAQLARKYQTLILEEMDLRNFRREAPTEGDTQAGNAAALRARQHLVAPGELRTALIGAFEARGGKVVLVDAKNTTRGCHKCGSVEEFDAATYRTHLCSACGVVWDQDENACRNMLLRFKQRPPEEPKEKKQSKWGRLGRHTVAPSAGA